MVRSPDDPTVYIYAKGNATEVITDRIRGIDLDLHSRRVSTPRILDKGVMSLSVDFIFLVGTVGFLIYWDWQLALVSHGNSFGTGRGRPDYLLGRELPIGDAWRSALLRLDDKMLGENLGDVLDKRRLKALAKRRDQLLDK